MDVSAATWPTLSKLLDEALDLEPAARDAWLENLEATQPDLAPFDAQAAGCAREQGNRRCAWRACRRFPCAFTRRELRRSHPAIAVGPYRLKRELGAGGMADVWLAERADGAFARDVALKLPLISRLRRDLAQRFTRERDILARLEHPHIARLVRRRRH